MFNVTVTDKTYTVTCSNKGINLTFTGGFEKQWKSDHETFNVFLDGSRVIVVNLATSIFYLKEGESITNVVEARCLGNLAIITNKRTIWCDIEGPLVLPINDPGVLKYGFSFWNPGEAKALGVRDEKPEPIPTELFIDSFISFN